MTKANESFQEVSIHISRSSMTTEVNKTGSWRFVRPKYDEKTAPCSAACPAGEDIARIEMLAGQGLFEAAVETVLLENPFPAVCGRVCFHPCENACNRAGLDAPVAIHSLERFLGDGAAGGGLRLSLDKLPDNGKKVCIVGSGPAGLAAAYFLTRLGYLCDVFEAGTEPGGLLRWGIPEYRLPASVLKHDIDRIENLGINIHCNTPVTRRFLKDAKQRYDAVFIGCGHGRSLQMGIAGEELASDGLGFLYHLRRGQISAAGGTAAVIGGGNAAVDVARSLVRLGTTVVLAYRRRRQDMPAFQSEVAMAVEEGVEIMELVAPVRIEADGGESVLTLQKMKVSPAQTGGGRARVVPDGETTRGLKVDRIFTAIGAEALEPWQLPPAENSQTLRMSHCTLTIKEQPMVFGGDLTNRLKSVTDAIASGKQAAMALDIFFKSGLEVIQERLSACLVGKGPALSMARYLGVGRTTRNSHIVLYDEINRDYFLPAARAAATRLDVDKRMQSVAQIEQTLTSTQVLEETGRCFNCGICNDCDNCRLFCPEIAVTLTGTRRQVNLDYCKGCGICVVECPRNAMALEEEP